MYDPRKLPVEIWAEKFDGRTRIMVKVGDDDAVEAFSWPEGYEKQGVRSGSTNGLKIG